MSIDALMHNIFELHNTIAIRRVGGGIDQKVKQISEQYGLLKPGSHDIEELYQKENLAFHIEKWITEPESLEHLQSFENAIVKMVSCIAPNLELDKRIQRQDEFTKACMQPSVLDGSDLSRLEKILKEGPVDLSAIYMPIMEGVPIKGCLPLLQFVLEKAAKDSLLTFLFDKGLTVDTYDEYEIKAIMNYLVPADKDKEGHFTTSLLEAFLKADFDINATLPQQLHAWYQKLAPPTAETTLLFRALKNEDYPTLRNLVYHGAGDWDDWRLFLNTEGKGYIKLLEALRLRKETLEKMQQNLPEKQRKSYGDLTIIERENLAKLCQERQRFRDAFMIKMANTKSVEETSKEMDERIELHNAFIKACLEGNFDEAEKLLSQDIDINANLIPHPEVYKAAYPLLNHACKLGNVKLVEFLLKHGAKCNIGSDEGFPAWFPPILECAISESPSKKEIIAMLLKAGANLNEKGAGNRYWAGQLHFRAAFSNRKVNKKELLDVLSLCGMDINIPNRYGESLFDGLFRKLTRGGDEFEEDLELAKLLIYYGAKIREEELEQIDELKSLKPLQEAIKLRDKAMHEFLNDHLKELEDLKPLSMDLINIIAGYPTDIELPPQQRAIIAHLCLKDKDEG